MNFLIKRDEFSLSDQSGLGRITLEEVKRFVHESAEFEWRTEPHGTEIRNSDGTTSILPPFSGFRKSVDCEAFLNICYESYGGIAVHTDGAERTHVYCRIMAASLGAVIREI